LHFKIIFFLIVYFETTKPNEFSLVTKTQRFVNNITLSSLAVPL
jgi:hypothetical protein